MHYQKALAINPKSSVILCHIGVVQHALKETEKALTTFNTAIANNPKNALCKFHRGSIYFALGRHAEALKELEELKQIVPKESLVYYLIGKCSQCLKYVNLLLFLPIIVTLSLKNWIAKYKRLYLLADRKRLRRCM